MEINIEQILNVYKQRVAELEHELIIQKVVNDTLKEKMNELMKHAHVHDDKEGE